MDDVEGPAATGRSRCRQNHEYDASPTFKPLEFENWESVWLMWVSLGPELDRSSTILTVALSLQPPLYLSLPLAVKVIFSFLNFPSAAAMFISLLALIVAAWGFTTLGLPLFRNWSIAQRLKVPVIVCPIPRHGRMSRRFQALFKAKILLSWRGIFPFLRILRPNWPFLEKHAIFEDYGDVFAIVTPARCELFIADTKAARQILMRKKDFPKPLDLTSRLNIELCRLSHRANKAARKAGNIRQKLGYCIIFPSHSYLGLTALLFSLGSLLKFE